MGGFGNVYLVTGREALMMYSDRATLGSLASRRGRKAIREKIDLSD